MPVWKQIVILVCLSLGFFLVLQSFPSFPDPDSFYHAALSEELLVTRTPIFEFTALPYTVLARFVDHHFLYHLFVSPFIGLLRNPFWGLKFATALFASFAIGTFFYVLRTIRAPLPFWGALFLLAINPFVFRLNLGKASAISLIFLLLGLVNIRERRIAGTALIAFLYVWLFDGWILFPLVAALYWGGESIGAVAYESDELNFKNYIRTLFHPAVVRCGAALLGGLILGMVVNVYFPENIYFFLDHIFRIGFLEQQTSIGVGGEWLGYPLLSLLSSIAPLFALVILSLCVFVGGFRHHQKDLFGFLALAVFFIFAVLRARRNIEYTVPFVLLWSLAVFRTQGKFVSLIRSLVGVRKRFSLSLLALALGLGTVVVDIHLLVGRFRNGIALTTFQSEAVWLREHTEPNEVVFHSDWSEFPSLYAYNRTNRYIAGLDPRFLYFQNPVLFNSWSAITRGEQKDRLAEDIATVFHARYVLVSKDHTDFEENLIRGGFVKQFEGKDASIYQVP